MLITLRFLLYALSRKQDQLSQRPSYPVRGPHQATWINHKFSLSAAHLIAYTSFTPDRRIISAESHLIALNFQKIVFRERFLTDRVDADVLHRVELGCSNPLGILSQVFCI